MGQVARIEGRAKPQGTLRSGCAGQAIYRSRQDGWGTGAMLGQFSGQVWPTSQRL